MRAVLILALASLIPASMAHSQVWVGQTIRDASSGETMTTTTTANHAVSSDPSALELMQAMGIRKRFDTDRTKGMNDAKQQLLREYPNLTNAFVNEWAKKVSAQLNPDDYVAIAARVYSSHFSDDELDQLAQGQRNANAGRPSALPPALRDKLRRLLPTLAGEIAGGFAQTGATLGAQVAQQVAKEHPDWIKRSPTASK